ncbi:NAD-dependent epimerase/dehydratase family protein [Streptomyces sp. cg35]|uniref:NAD-dependent epimerase/dehydratase family protein n=1 Tax=Streptomyces sp. cg35 TaxID=3421650 RepID=UPI003D17A41E
MTPWTVALTGATGFIGSAVLQRLLGRPSPVGGPVQVRVLMRRTGVALPGGGAVRQIRGDLADAASLTALLDGADALVHTASYVGKDAERCEAVNLRGTADVMAAARASALERIVHLSTAAVYGAGPHRGIDVDAVVPQPVSAASRTRLMGERFALDAGALVLRPGLVIGEGDRWVVPAYAELAERVLPEWLGGTGLLSVVDVGDLARLVAAAATATTTARGVQHAAHPEPVSTGQLRKTLSAHGLVAPARGSADWDECRALVAHSQGRYGERQLELLSLDHFYLSERIWQLLDTEPGPGPLARLDEAADWYRHALAERGQGAGAGSS